MSVEARPRDWLRFGNKEVKKASGKPDTSGPCNTLCCPFSSKGIHSSLVHDLRLCIEQDENLDPSIVHLHHDPPSTSHRNKEGLRPYCEKPSQRSILVRRMVKRSKNSAPVVGEQSKLGGK
ncbi:hypothetical protein K443DRAFT_685467 [Laccaria amethystina LaAM-08-1]|uniref:Uncharacterized protein n=1 Tax=Laccaria amethystina LaAM-08-1 TaxID=1095629 RepID=A0A0C9WUF0_9AGAR|nr:hypothetical protein K443DRAFT_685467 [Laccaria amethystina LaAM-08-1]